MSDWSADGLGHFRRQAPQGRMEANCRLRIEMTGDGETTITILRITDGSLVGTATAKDWKFLTRLKSALEILMAEEYRNRKIVSNWKPNKMPRGTVDDGKET